MNLKTILIASLVILTTSLHADTIGFGNNNPGRDPWGGGPGDSRDPWGNQNSDRDVEVQLNRYFEGQTRLNLLEDAYTRMQLQGKSIREVTITASSENGNGKIRLLANQQSAEQPRTVARQLARYTFRVDPFANTINQNLRALELEMRGRFYVEKVIFTMLQNNTPTYPNYPGPGTPSQPQVEVVRKQFNESIQQEGGLNIYNIFNLGIERQGQVLKRVTVTARSQRGHSQGELLVNDQGSGQAQTIGTNSTRLSFELSGQKIGREIQHLRLQFRGYLVVEEVTLEFARDRSPQYPGPGPIDERRIEQSVNQKIYVVNELKLIDLMRVDRRHENRIVESIEIFLNGSRNVGKIKLCQEAFSRSYSSVDCSNDSLIIPGMRVVRLSPQSYARLSELSLTVHIGMIDIDKIAINFR